MTEENQEYKTQIIEATDEFGNTTELELIEVVEVEGVEYAILQKVDEEDSTEEDAEEAVLMRLIKHGDSLTFETIDDDEEFNIVADYIANLDDEEE